MAELNKLEEEVFCLKFELDSLSEVLIKQESERWLPGFAYTFVEHDHLERYNLASKYVHGKQVLDIACGAGKGSFILATSGKAKTVLGGDLCQIAVRYATHRYKQDNSNYKIIDALKPELEGLIFDVIVSFETIEHLLNTSLFLENIKKTLKKDGIFIVSTPISSKLIDHRPNNPYHPIEWGFYSFQEYVKQYFEIEEIFIQLYPKKAPLQSGMLKRLLKKAGLKRFQNPEQAPFVSKMEKFNNQYPLAEIGTDRIGYQILICKSR